MLHTTFGTLRAIGGNRETVLCVLRRGEKMGKRDRRADLTCLRKAHTPVSLLHGK